MKVTVIPIVNGMLGTVIKGSVQGLEDLEIRGLVDTIQTTELSRSVGRVMEKNNNNHSVVQLYSFK